MDKSKKLLRRKQALAAGGAALAAFGTGAAIHANAHAANTQPQTQMIKNGSPAIQTVNEKAASQQGQQNGLPHLNNNVNRTQTTKSAPVAHTAPQAHTDNNVGHVAAAQQSVQKTVPDASSQSNHNVSNLQKPVHVNNNLNINNTPNVQGQNLNIQNKVQRNFNPKQPSNTVSNVENPNKQVRQDQKEVKAPTDNLGQTNNEIRGINKANQIDISKQNRLNQASKTANNANGIQYHPAGKTAAELNRERLARLDNFHPVFIVGQPKGHGNQANNQQANQVNQKDVNKLRDSANTGLENMGIDARNENVDEAKIDNVLTRAQNNINNAKNEQDISKINSQATDEINNLERQNELNEVMAPSPFTVLDDTPDTPADLISQLQSKNYRSGVKPFTEPAANLQAASPSVSGTTLNIGSGLLSVGKLNDSGQYNNITTVNLNGTTLPEFAQGIFSGMPNLTTVNSTNVDASHMANMSNLFGGDSKLTDISGLANWNVNGGASMDNMFNGDSSLSNISPLSSWQPQYNSMSNMFHNTNVSDLNPLSNWDISDVNDLDNMFSGDSALKDISPIGNWTPTNATDVSNMFNGDGQLSDWSPIQSWTFTSKPNDSGMLSGTKANSGSDPSFTQSNGSYTFSTSSSNQNSNSNGQNNQSNQNSTSNSNSDNSNSNSDNSNSNSNNSNSNSDDSTSNFITNGSSSASSSSNDNSTSNFITNGSDSNSNSNSNSNAASNFITNGANSSASNSSSSSSTAASNFIVSPSNNGSAASSSTTGSTQAADNTTQGSTGKTSTSTGASNGSKASSSASSTDQDTVYYTDKDGQVVGSDTVSGPSGSILDMTANSPYNRAHMPAGYHYDDDSDPQAYEMRSGMSPIDVQVSKNKSASASNSSNGSNNSNHASWQRGAVTPEQLTHPSTEGVTDNSGVTPSPNVSGKYGDSSSTQGGTGSTNGTTGAAGGTTAASSPAESTAGVSGAGDSDSGSAGGSSELPQTGDSQTVAAIVAGLGMLFTLAGADVSRKHHLQLLEIK